MRKILPPLLIALVLAGAGTAGWRWQTQWRWVESTDNAYVDGDITPVSPKIAAHVAEILVGDNQPVKAGDVLLRLDDRDFKANLAQAQAQLAARDAALLQLEDRIKAAEAATIQAGAGVAAAKAELTRSKADLDRANRLVRDDFLSRQRFDAQAAEAAKAQAGLTGSAAQVTGAKRQLAALEAERQVAQAQRDQALALLDLARSDLDATIIRAPADGVVGNRLVRTGMYVRPGQLLLSLVPLSTIWVDANFKETQIGRIIPGMRAIVTADAFPGRHVTARIQGFSPATGAKFSLLPPENATGNFTKVVQRVPVRLILDPHPDLAGRLVPGLSVLVEIDTRP